MKPCIIAFEKSIIIYMLLVKLYITPTPVPMVAEKG